jgi:hypothetical protein
MVDGSETPRALLLVRELFQDEAAPIPALVVKNSAQRVDPFRRLEGIGIPHHVHWDPFGFAQHAPRNNRAFATRRHR